MADANGSQRAASSRHAETALQRALSIDPYDAAAYNVMGRVLAKNETSTALHNFHKATHLRPNYGPDLYDYALGALVRAQRLEEGRAQAQAAVNADPNLAQSRALLRGLLARDQRLAETTSEYQYAVKLQPDFNLLHLDLGLILAAQGDLQGATEHLRKAAADKDPNVARQAAQALQRIGNR